MTARKKAPQQNTREAKKAIVMNTAKKGPVPIVIVAAIVIAVAAGLGLFLLPANQTRTTPVAGAPPILPTAKDADIAYPVSLFGDGQARHFKFSDTENDITITYFILKSTDGIIRAAFDACDVCWPEGKGYVQDGAAMICRNCGRRFESVMINEVKGGCNPAPLNRTIQGDRVVIRVEDLKKGSGYFNFSNKKA